METVLFLLVVTLLLLAVFDDGSNSNSIIEDLKDKDNNST